MIAGKTVVLDCCAEGSSGFLSPIPGEILRSLQREAQQVTILSNRPEPIDSLPENWELQPFFDTPKGMSVPLRARQHRQVAESLALNLLRQEQCLAIATHLIILNANQSLVAGLLQWLVLRQTAFAGELVIVLDAAVGLELRTTATSRYLVENDKPLADFYRQAIALLHQQVAHLSWCVPSSQKAVELLHLGASDISQHLPTLSQP